MIEIIQAIRGKYPENAITLSIGERSYESYKKMFEAGANRYLLRHETATKQLYESLHPNASYENRIQCLYNLKEILKLFDNKRTIQYVYIILIISMVKILMLLMTK